MKNRTASNIPTVSKTLCDRYGVAASAADPITIEWAVDYALDNGATVEAVKAEVRKINAARARLGRITFSPAYGSRIF